jgi:hypothetical protein
VVAESWLVALANGFGLIALAIAVATGASTTKRIILLAIFVCFFLTLFLGRHWFTMRTGRYSVALITCGVLVLISGVINFRNTSPTAVYYVVDATDNARMIFPALVNEVRQAIDPTAKVGLGLYGSIGNECSANSNLVSPERVPEINARVAGRFATVSPGSKGSLARGLELAKAQLLPSRGKKVVNAIIVRPHPECDPLADPVMADVARNWPRNIQIVIHGVAPLSSKECAIIGEWLDLFKHRATFKYVGDITQLHNSLLAAGSYGISYFPDLGHGPASTCS